MKTLRHGEMKQLPKVIEIIKVEPRLPARQSALEAWLSLPSAGDSRPATQDDGHGTVSTHVQNKLKPSKKPTAL